MRRILALLTAVAATLVLSATPAAAGTVSVDYVCNGGSIVSFPATYLTTITAPASVSQGDTATVRIEYTGVVPWHSDTAAGTYTGQGGFKLGGAATGLVQAPWLSNPAIRAGEVMRFTGASAQVTFPNKGQVTFTPDRFFYRAGCILRNTASVAATTNVL
ncbi:hypothetical protein [Amycolatopsis sp. 195334CR]|uniref:hypothetical protein n=1 Tax=Amycolatopsis sp. 195334CR TaxID=2814588 RepID=UPI001A8F3E95|nr:hypothetical protein [Amycolatopsis sp. 195334CR]MBN6037364.1 hypothetical protein [Amycolatopsis sp. 195334CR]